ncbi:MAG: type IX secretion system protein PorQ [Flavobacteriaceae bacterium]|nr:type IX secretion system protein PorQ [Bacteroidia bacterium]NNL15058.1 type IX secretion system protein PorQ [Flavobacteriaceae bacterium]
MHKKISFFISVLIAPFVFSQIGGESTYQFLNLVSSPRQAALGGKIITIYDYDVSQPIFNPASINPEMDGQIALNYSSYLGGIGYGTASYAYTIDRRTKTIHGGVTYINYGNFEGYDENGISTGSFSGSETALSLGYAFNIPWSDIYLGSNLKFITSKLEQYSSFGMALDIGALYINDKIGFQAALSIRNLGTQISTYAGENEPLPLEIDFGMSQQLENVPIRWHLTIENIQTWNISKPNPARVITDLNGNQTDEKIGFFNNALRHLVLGAELFPDKGFNIRLGYNFRRAEELRILEQRNFSGLSFGVGLKMKKIRFSYSHARYSSAANTSFFGLNIDLN